MYVQSNTQCITIAIHMGKIAKTFRLSEEVVRILDQADNATEFIEKSILSKGTPTPWKDIENKLDLILKNFQVMVRPDTAPPIVLSEELPPIDLPECCTTLKKCQHWSYNELDEVWVHRLTGETREAD